jgi:GntR family transcriptional regulator of vanillate catabolism
MVKAFSERDILDSIELRGTLEGLAARFAAERGVSSRDLEPLKECLNEIDGLVRQEPISMEAFSSYVALNARFHVLLAELSRSPPLIRQIDRASAHQARLEKLMVEAGGIAGPGSIGGAGAGGAA